MAKICWKGQLGRPSSTMDPCSQLVPVGLPAQDLFLPQSHVVVAGSVELDQAGAIPGCPISKRCPSQWCSHPFSLTATAPRGLRKLHLPLELKVSNAGIKFMLIKRLSLMILNSLTDISQCLWPYVKCTNLFYRFVTWV